MHARERVRGALTCQVPDRIPLSLGFFSRDYSGAGHLRPVYSLSRLCRRPGQSSLKCPAPRAEQLPFDTINRASPTASPACMALAPARAARRSRVASLGGWAPRPAASRSAATWVVRSRSGSMSCRLSLLEDEGVGRAKRDACVLRRAGDSCVAASCQSKRGAPAVGIARGIDPRPSVEKAVRVSQGVVGSSRGGGGDVS